MNWIRPSTTFPDILNFRGDIVFDSVGNWQCMITLGYCSFLLPSSFSLSTSCQADRVAWSARLVNTSTVGSVTGLVIRSINTRTLPDWLTGRMVRYQSSQLGDWLLVTFPVCGWLISEILDRQLSGWLVRCSHGWLDMHPVVVYLVDYLAGQVAG